jgi:hypothetical protein
MKPYTSRTPSETGPRGVTPRPCPLCGHPLTRITRTATDRLLGLVRVAYRYRCMHFSCQWEGMLRPGKASTAPSLRGTA